MSEIPSEKSNEDNVEPISPEVEAQNLATESEENNQEEEADADADADASDKETAPVEEDFKEKYYYLAAEMENLRKRFDRERQNFIKYGNEKVLSGLIEVIDNLDRTSDAISTEEDDKIKNVWTGVEMVRKQFAEVLKSNGLEQIESIGKTFDPNIHEAMAGQPAEGKENDEIITEFQKGYTLNGRLLRAAKVIIVNND